MSLLTSVVLRPSDNTHPPLYRRCRSTCLLEVGEHRAALEDACTLIDQDPSMEDAVVLKASALLRLELVRAQGLGTACYVVLVSPHLTCKWSEGLNRVWERCTCSDLHCID
jgi:hypothetical protein